MPAPGGTAGLTSEEFSTSPLGFRGPGTVVGAPIFLKQGLPKESSCSESLEDASEELVDLGGLLKVADRVEPVEFELLSDVSEECAELFEATEPISEESSSEDSLGPESLEDWVELESPEELVSLSSVVY